MSIQAAVIKENRLGHSKGARGIGRKLSSKQIEKKEEPQSPAVPVA